MTILLQGKVGVINSKGGGRIFCEGKGGGQNFLHAGRGGAKIFSRALRGGPEKIDDRRSRIDGPPLPVKNDNSLMRNPSLSSEMRVPFFWEQVLWELQNNTIHNSFIKKRSKQEETAISWMQQPHQNNNWETTTLATTNLLMPPPGNSTKFTMSIVPLFERLRGFCLHVEMQC